MYIKINGLQDKTTGLSLAHFVYIFNVITRKMYIFKGNWSWSTPQGRSFVREIPVCYSKSNFK